MRLSQFILTSSCVLAAQIAGTSTLADVFGSGENQFEIEFVTIGDPGNPPDEDPNPAGAVDYSYRIGKYEVSEDAIRKANATSAAAGDPLDITIDARGPDKPATSVSWFEAARFVNWLNEDRGFSPAYKFDDNNEFQLWTPDDPGYDAENLFRNRGARYVLPSIDEWHKAAYYDPVSGAYFDYPTGSDDVPDGIDFPGDTEFDAVFFDGGDNGGPNDVTNVGLLSPFGTAGQGGNVAEWDETAFDRNNDVANEQRRASGGAWSSTASVLLSANTLIGDAPGLEVNAVGIRVASVIPEPNTFVLLAMGVLSFARTRKIRISLSPL